MKQQKPKVEILAPAGSVEQLIAAVNNGCDSVYLGLDSLNARMKAPNFTLENVGEWIDYCHLYGVKVYVALNTSIKNDEFAQAANFLAEVYKRNADGVIVTDLALMRIAGGLPKPFEVVASTQLNVHDGFGADFLKKCGASTVVCARESSLDEIKSIVASGVKTECFVHGATCVCQSGQCLFSAMVGGNSGNRGLCAQPCRKLYASNATEGKQYLLSARDLCGIDSVQKMYDVGVEVFKIEGRNRRAEYAGIASKTYKKLFDSNFDCSDSDRRELAEMYNRSMSSLSYLNGGNGDIIYSSAQNHVGVPVGKIKNGVFYAEVDVTKGDGLKVFDGNAEYCGGVAIESGDGIVKAEFDRHVSDGMIVHRTTSIKLCQDVLNAKRKLPIAVSFCAKPNDLATISARYNDMTVTVMSEFVVQQANTRATSNDEVVEQLRKTGDSPFTITDIAIDVENVFLAKSQINAMRRNLLGKLAEEIVQNYNRIFADRATVNFEKIYNAATKLNANFNNALTQKSCSNNDNFLAVICYTKDQLISARKFAKYLIFRPHVVNFVNLQLAKELDCYVDLPSFSDNEYFCDLLEKTQCGIVCHNVGHVELARKLHLKYIAGSGLNIYNDFIANEFADAETFVYSHELTLGEIAQFANQNGLVFIDGKLTLMKLVHCPYKVAYSCTCSNCMASKPLTYTDELGNKFDFVRRKDTRCTFELLNGNKLSVVSKLKSGGRYMLDYDESVIEHYAKLNEGVVDDYVETQPYTKGRLFNKVN